ncbi:MAG: mobile mystery protein B [Sediminibacterium sp. Gen4]|jgi:Fic-DOC domain mobile mystery protein B|uniref:mobile mystery protein B n=1 Tax=unclassified Sediminibacterium TaxID=2635961 RepID=UPI0015B95824|nr:MULTISPECIES: mobile mystery protein B [unclassified Sediminibacterium]MBW0161824.1 mobile mystery protein B [Sediminibacterium sp.]MBW0165029.1 mobile mystery protein B [Sediminibacterium sp.]NWK64483.1 mobile mystery protein B [Sediminibacterium sp. Gen4]
MGLDFDYADGQTPLDEDEKDALLIPSITTRGELDEFEQLNIENAMVFYWSKRITMHTFFTEAFIKAVHKKMYGDVWNWAGEFRKTDKNIGVDKWTISIALKELLDDALYWVQHNVYKPEEIAIRFKHRLVSIHCFPNGNGRHSRFMADLLLYRVYKQERPFSWGAISLVKQEDARATYLKALKEADRGNMEPLILFAKS